MEITGTTSGPFLVTSVTVYKTKGFAQRDFSEAPKFTQPLVNCTTVTGYDTQLFCCVRASPKVSGEFYGRLCHAASAPALTLAMSKSVPTRTFVPITIICLFHNRSCRNSQGTWSPRQANVENIPRIPFSVCSSCLKMSLSDRLAIGNEL